MPALLSPLSALAHLHPSVKAGRLFRRLRPPSTPAVCAHGAVEHCITGGLSPLHRHWTSVDERSRHLCHQWVA
eukprot:1166194-Prymnesium_polylepis.1